MIKLIDLCCKAGGCSVGYKQAADELGTPIEIVGVDIEPQPNYPFEFVQADAVTFLRKNYGDFSHVHASPPCQKYSKSTAQYRKIGKKYRDNIDQLTELMYEIGLPGVIENVPSYPVRADVILRGDMFNLKVLRQRHFELVNWFMMSPLIPMKIGSVKNGDYCSVFGKGSYRKSKNDAIPKFKKGSVRETWAYAMGIDWYMKDIELAEAIPPAYTKYIGLHFFT